MLLIDLILFVHFLFFFPAIETIAHLSIKPAPTHMCLILQKAVIAEKSQKIRYRS